MVIEFSEIQEIAKHWIEETKEEYVKLFFKEQTLYIIINGKPKQKKIHIFFEIPNIDLFTRKKNYRPCIQLQYFENNDGNKYLRLDDYYFEVNKENSMTRNSCKVIEHVLMFEIFEWMAAFFGCDFLTLNDEATKRSELCNWDLGLFQKIVRGTSFYEKYGFQYRAHELRNILENKNLDSVIDGKLWTSEMKKWLMENRVDEGEQQGKTFDQLTVRQLIETIYNICIGKKVPNKWDKFLIYNELRWVIYAVLFFGKQVKNNQDVMKCCFGFMPIDNNMEKPIQILNNHYKLEFEDGNFFDKKIIVKMRTNHLEQSKSPFIPVLGKRKSRTRSKSSSKLRRSQRIRMSQN